jgi:hypothetical protein
MPLTLNEFTRQTPALLTSPPIVGLSSDAEPTVGEDGGALETGQLWHWEDTGHWKYYTGSAWKLVDFNQTIGLAISLLFEIRDLLQGDDE